MTIWKKLRIKINALSIRERKLIAITSMSFVLSLFVLLAWHPLWVNYQGIKNRSEQMIVGINASKYDIRVLEERSKKDVSLPYRNKLQSLKQKSNEQQDKINSITNALIQPEKMNLVFKGLLEKSNLRFDSIKNQKPKVIELNESKDSNQVLYEHGLVIEMHGSYLDGLAYIKSIENQSWQLYWDEVEYKTTGYPQGELTLKVHTISTSKKVLGL